MGYLTTLYLIDIKIKEESIPIVERALKTKKGRGLTSLQYFLSRAVFDIGGCLSFKPQEDDMSPYEPDSDYGDVPALMAKWYEAEKIASWIKRHSEKGGQIILNSNEGDGAAWGWEFDGKGRMRELALCSVGKWN